jgi:hypothetical protein
VFQGAFLPNAAIFAVGCAAAVYLLRTGIAVWGAIVLAGVALGADLALVARFVFDGKGPWFSVGLWTMQALALGSALWLVVALSRKKWAKDSTGRGPLLQAALQHYLRGEFDRSRGLYARVRCADPWHLGARIGLANAEWRLGRPAVALRMLAAARRLDRDRTHGDLLTEQERRVRAALQAARSGASRAGRGAAAG